MLNVTKLSPFYPGQWGVRGSDDSRGLRVAPQGLVYYVDASHANANDNNDGTDPDEPFATIQAAITANNATINWAATPPYDGVNQIVIAPGEYVENLTPPYYCEVYGLGSATGQTNDICVNVHPATGSALAGTGLAALWKNIRFTTDDANPVIDFDTCNSCVFDSCMIIDGNPGLATVGIDIENANSSLFLNCRFIGTANPVTIGLRSTGNFVGCEVIGCQISAVTTAIHLTNAGSTCENTLIAHNYIEYPVNGIICANAHPWVINNYIGASVDAISHPDPNHTLTNRTIVGGAGAIETAGT